MARALPEPHPRSAECTVDGSKVVLIGTIQGLSGERIAVEESWARLQPEALGLGVPPEDVANLDRIETEGVDAFMEQELDTGSYENTLLPQLARFGDVAIPPDDLMAAAHLAKEHDVQPVALDIDDETHADLYVNEIGGLAMMRGQMVLRKLQGGRLDAAESAEQLLLLWDRAFTGIKGYGKIERKREETMAEGIRSLAAQASRVLVVLPYARLPGVVAQLT